ncbi:hypothetical protein DY245_32500 [Streptomyces inhibens]|uniref:Uncharacterized protein n=1 Tax=Streptomyces inhibens TaxID=2293571 RepID=A0A371PVE8_STRIH|nr:hypothetical protein DY245_32500 [Streptomyces inhibens]
MASKLWGTSRTRSVPAKVTSAAFPMVTPWADRNTIRARRQLTTAPAPLRMIRSRRCPSLSSISRTRTRSPTQAL